VVTASEDSTAIIWDAGTGTQLAKALRHGALVRFAQFSLDGRRVVTASEDYHARIWDAESGRLLAEPMRHQARVTSAVFSPDGLRVLTSSRDRTARIWDAETGYPLTEPLVHGGTVNYAEFGRDGRRVITACSDGSCVMWETPAPPLPAASWLPDLAEAVGGQRLNSQRMLEPVPAENWFEVKSRLIQSTADNGYSYWLPLLLTDD